MINVGRAFLKQNKITSAILKPQISYLTGVVSIIFIAIFIYIWNDPLVSTICLVVLTLIAMFSVNFDMLHPLCWFSPIFCLYSISTPILIWLDIQVDVGFLQETMLLQWIALASFILAVGSNRSKTISATENTVGRFFNLPGVTLIYTISIIMSGVYLLYIWFSGVTNKSDLKLTGSPFLILESSFSIIAIAYVIKLSVYLSYNKKIPWQIVIFTFLWNMFAFLFSGERDYVINILVLTIFILHIFYQPIQLWKLLIIGTLLLIFIPILQELKSGILQDNLTINLTDNILIEVLNDEFRTASQNLQRLLYFSPYWNYFYGSTVLSDIMNIFVPGSIIELSMSSTLWFNTTFYPYHVAQGQGIGFTLVGDGYINFGIWGVIIWFTLLGWVIKFVYLRMNKNIIHQIIYIMMIPIVIYSIRDSSAVIFIQPLKRILVPIIIISVINQILIKLVFVTRHTTLRHSRLSQFTD